MGKRRLVEYPRPLLIHWIYWGLPGDPLKALEYDCQIVDPADLDVFREYIGD